jgi:hypothetical protein
VGLVCGDQRPSGEDRIWLDLDLRQMIFDSVGWLTLISYREQLADAFTMTDVQTQVSKRFPRKGSNNLYRAGVSILQFQEDSGAEPPRFTIPSDDHLESWQEFLGHPEPGSIVGIIRYSGGDLRKRAALDPKELTPGDFRLRPDSAGYRAGPDGKDLGADVDLVGPGEAYQRWKETPDYQQWREETRKLMQTAEEGRETSEE